MAIFGNFAEMPVLDVLSVAARSPGIFQARDFTGGSLFEAHFKPGLLVHAETDGQHHGSEEDAANAVGRLLRSHEGEFELRRVDPAQLCNNVVGFHFDTLLLLAAKGIDENSLLGTTEDELPSADTIFVIARGRAIEVQKHLGGWPAEVLLGLQAGASATELSKATALQVLDILRALKALRAVGAIHPRRETAPVPTAAPSEPTSVFTPVTPKWFTGGNLLQTPYDSPRTPTIIRSGSLAGVHPAVKPSGLPGILSFLRRKFETNLPTGRS